MDQSQRSSNSEESIDIKMQPLYVFLASSLNVELVYIILKSISKFTDIERDQRGNSILSRTSSGEMVASLLEDTEEDYCTLKISELEIDNPNRWSASAEMEDYIQNNRVSTKIVSYIRDNISASGSQISDDEPNENPNTEPSAIKYHSNISVTFHKRKLFMDTFSEYFSNKEVIEQSLSPSMNRDQVFKAGEGAGRSGSFFFFSHDRKFIIKTMSKGELNLLLGLMEPLAEHFKNNPHSLLAKILGVFTVKSSATNEVHLMLMENTLQLQNPEGLKYIFDLKGSLVDRKVKGKTTPSTTLKDVNFLMAAEATPGFIDLGEKKRKHLLSVVKKDSEFLSSHGLMDYSLLLAVETKPDDEYDQELDQSLDVSLDFSRNEGQNFAALGILDVGELMTKQHSFTHGNRIYHMAVIDFLQEWNLQKRGERFIKTTLMGKDPDNLSAIEP